MAIILHLMGPTCAGKSTIINKLTSLSPDVAAVQIGKLMRAKYGEAFFKGQAAPEHTRDEALKMYLDEITKAIDQGKKLVLVDGQPRDLSQAKVMVRAWPEQTSLFYLIHADHEVREARARADREPGPNLDLAIARLDNDYKNNYIVLTELIAQGISVRVVDTGFELFNVDDFCFNLLTSLRVL